MRALTGAGMWTTAATVWAALAGAAALSCWQCGEYSDGVGSITPCLNTSTLRLVACAPHADTYCIKYASELSTVRDCAAVCVERDSWGARTFCCNESDGCNGSTPPPAPAHAALLLAVLAAAAAAARA